MRLRLLFFVIGVCAASCQCDDGSLTTLEKLLVVDVERLVFGDVYVGGARALSVRLTSAGTAPVSIQAEPPAGAGPFVLVRDVPEVLRAGESVDVEVVFGPTTVGAAAAVLGLQTNAENQRRFEVALEGTGLAPLDCDDQNDCTDEVFDANDGTCLRANRSGACDDGNACTEDDRCDDGACVGDAIVCEDDIACTLDACEADSGCVFVPRPSECADADPCSLDVCDLNTGCTNPPAPDGTLCGDVEPCQTLRVCILHQCTDVPIPEGSPCSDGDVCTSGDQCTAGACVGVLSDTPPALVGESVLFYADRVELARGRIAAGPETLKVLESPSGPVTTNGLVHDLFALETDGEWLLATVGIPPRALFAVDPLAPLATTSPLDVDAAAFERGAFVADGHAYLCSSAGTLTTVELASGAVAAPIAAAQFCSAGVSQSAVSGGLAFGSDFGGEGRLPLFQLDPSGPSFVTDVATPVSIDGYPLTLFRDGLGARRDGPETATLIDARDTSAITTASLTLDPPHPPSAVYLFAVRAPYLYAHDYLSVWRYDISDIDAPVLDPWELSPPTSYVVPTAIDDERLVYFDWSTHHLFEADLVTGVVTLIPAQGKAGELVSASETDVVTRTGVQLVRRDTPVLPTLPAEEWTSYAGAALVQTPATTSLSSTELGGVYLHSEFGLLPSPFAPRPERAASLTALASGTGLDRVVFGIPGEEGVHIAATVAFPSDVTALFAPVARGCIGAALGVPAGADCAAPGCPAEVFALSTCSAGADVVPLSRTPVPGLFESDLAVASSSAHGDRVIFLGEEAAALVDLMNPLAPTILTAQIPELADARYASAAADDRAWLVIAMQRDGPHRAILFDVDVSGGAGVAERLAEWDLEASTGVEIARRALGVSWPRAFVSDWTPSDEPFIGHRIDIYDLTTDPPTLSDSIALASAARSLVVSDEDLTVVRGDGFSVISPPCGP